MLVQVSGLFVLWENSHNRRGKECGPFPIMCFAFIYICVCFPVWGHLSLNSWKQAVYSRALSKKKNTLTPDPWYRRGWLLAVGNHPSSDFAQLNVLNHWWENCSVLKCIHFLDQKACQFLTHDCSHSLQASVPVN